MRDIIIHDRINIGFSLRAIGSVENINGVPTVSKDKFKFITYDAVFNPSNGDEVIMSEQNIILNESEGHNSLTNRPILDNNGHAICIGNECSLLEYSSGDIKKSILKDRFTELMNTINF